MSLNTDSASKAANVSLVLNYAPLGLIRALRAEFGTQRILVDTGNIMLADDSEVDILLSIGGSEAPEYHHIHARVIGARSDGIILAVEHCESATIEALLPYITIH